MGFLQSTKEKFQNIGKKIKDVFTREKEQDQQQNKQKNLVNFEDSQLKKDLEKKGVISNKQDIFSAPSSSSSSKSSSSNSSSSSSSKSEGYTTKETPTPSADILKNITPSKRDEETEKFRGDVKKLESYGYDNLTARGVAEVEILRRAGLVSSVKEYVEKQVNSAKTQEEQMKIIEYEKSMGRLIEKEGQYFVPLSKSEIESEIDKRIISSYSVIEPAKSDKELWKEYVAEFGPITGSLKMLSLKIESIPYYFEREFNKIAEERGFQPSYFTEAESNLFHYTGKVGGEVAPYFIPYVGNVLLVGAGSEAMYREKTILGKGLGAAAIVTGGVGIYKNINAIRIAREEALFERTPTATKVYRLEDTKKGLDLTVSYKKIEPKNLFDKFVGVQKQEYLTTTVQPFIKAGERRMIVEEGLGRTMKLTELGKNKYNLNIISFNIKGVGKELQGQAKIITKSELKTIRELGEYTPFISSTKISTNWKGDFKIYQKNSEWILTGNINKFETEKFIRGAGIIKFNEEGTGLFVAGKPKGKIYSTGEKSLFFNKNEIGIVKRVDYEKLKPSLSSDFAESTKDISNLISNKEVSKITKISEKQIPSLSQGIEKSLFLSEKSNKNLISIPSIKSTLKTTPKSMQEQKKINENISKNLVVNLAAIDQMNKNKSLNKVESIVESKSKVNTRNLIKSVNVNLQESEIKTVQKVNQIQINKLSNREISFPNFPNTVPINIPDIPKIPFYSNFKIGFAKSNKLINLNTEKYLKYTPSLSSYLFNIKGKKLNKKYFTGLEIRPIPIK